MTQASERTLRWQSLVSQVRTEYQQLDPAERQWIHAACAEISHLQEQLDGLFRQGDGLRQCRDCRGDCCALGHNHLTLANLLQLLECGEELPALDYAATCPLLGERGCVLTAARRPYNCISFLCDRIEDQLPPAEVDRFYLLESRLRERYTAFARRYAGGSMSGLLLAARRLQGAPFLKRIDRD